MRPDASPDEDTKRYVCFGELALMYAKPRAASVVANTEGKLWSLSRVGFRLVQMIASAPAASGAHVAKTLRKVPRDRRTRPPLERAHATAA